MQNKTYSLTSTEEPTEEQLHQLMKEVAEDARERARIADEKFFANMKEMAQKSMNLDSRKNNI